MFALLILLSQKQDPNINESYNLIKRCKCVEYFWWIVDELLCMIYLSPLYKFFVLGHGLYFFLLFFFFDMSCGHVAYLLWVCIFSLFLALFFLCLLGMWHTFFGYASFISFCIAHILDGNLGERVMIELGVLFCEWMIMFAIF